MLVLARAEHRERVERLGARWADIEAHAAEIHSWEATYRQSVAGSPQYWRFCHTRWLMLAAELRARPLPPGGAVAVIDDDVLMFERVEQRLREAVSQRPHAHVEAAINGAFVIASAQALQVSDSSGGDPCRIV